MDNNLTTQIIKLTLGEGPELHLDQDQLSAVFASAAGRRIELITICGAAREGRSFLLNFILRYVQSLEASLDDVLAWDKPTAELSGFQWGPGDKCITQGVWITKKPFLVPNTTAGEEIAVFLLDTQGVGDEFSSPAQTQFLLQLCLKVSNTIIFTSMFELQEEKLITLAEALSAIDSPRCDRLCLVVRDWCQFGMYQTDEAGSSRYKEKRLQSQPHHSSISQAARKTLHAKVGCLECYLLPPPGPNIWKPDYNGNLAGLSTKFTGVLETFLLSILPQDRWSATPGGRKMTGEEVVTLFNSCFDIDSLSQSPIAPSPKPRTTTENEIERLCLSLIGEFESQIKSLLASAPRNYFDPPELLAQLEESKRITSERFASSDLRASFGLCSKYQELLATRLEEVSTKYKDLNAQHRDTYFGEWEQAVTKSEEIFEELVRKMLSASQLFGAGAKERFMKERFEKEAKECFDMIVDDRHLDHYAIYSQKLQDRFEDIFSAEKAIALEKRRKQEHEYHETCKSVAVEVYKVAMAEGVVKSENFIISEEELQLLHSEAVRKALAKIPRAPYDEDPRVDSSSDDQLNETFGLMLADIVAKNSAKCASLLEKKCELLCPAVENYRTTLARWTKGIESQPYSIMEELKEVHKKAYEAATLCLRTSTHSENAHDDSIMSYLVELLDKEVQEIYSATAAEQERLVRAWEDCLDAQKEEYNKRMCAALGYLPLQTPEAVHELHREITQELVCGVNAGEIGSIPSAVRHALSGEPLAEFQRKAAQQVKQRQQEADSLRNQAVELYQTQLKAVDLTSCPTKADFRKQHDSILAAVTRRFQENNEITDELFLQSYMNQIMVQATKIYEDQWVQYDLILKQQEISVQRQILAASEEYKGEMKQHFKQKPFMKRDAFRSVSEVIMTKIVGDCGGQLTQRGRDDLRDALETLYLGYQERNAMSTPTGSLAIGIDLGTTYSCAAVYHNGHVQMIPSGIGANTVPSYVAFTQEAELVGEAAKSQAHEFPLDTIFDAKRLIGRDFKDPTVQADMKLWPFKVVEKVIPKGKPVVVAASEVRDPELISGMVLRHMKTLSENYLNLHSIDKAVITVPAYFNDSQRQATKDAGLIAGLEVLQIVNEPTAAAMAYYLHSPGTSLRKKNILVYDLGGGTFDVSVLEIHKGNLNVKAVNGDTHLGGEDFDQSMVEFCLDKFKEKTGIDIKKERESEVRKNQVAAARQLRRLRNECEKRKRELSEAEHIVIAVDEVYGYDLNVKMSRIEFEKMNQAMFDLTIDIVGIALDDARLGTEEIDQIILVGGSTRIPKVQQLLSEFFGGRPLYRNLNPDEAVARGAAILAAKLNGEAEQRVMDMLFVDITPFAIGTEMRDGSMSIIVPRNTPIPCKVTKGGYATVCDNQTRINVRIYEGEDPIAKKNHFLGSFLLTNIPPGLAGQQTNHKTVEITKEGILHVKATLDTTGETEDIVIQADKGRLSPQALADLRESIARGRASL